MNLSGAQIIGGHESAVNEQTFTGVNPATGQSIEPEIHEASVTEVGHSLRLADESFDELRGRAPEERARLLDRIADEVMALGDALLDRANQETGLPLERLTTERLRATNQAKLFANLIREGSWVDARIDRGNPDRTPIPKPDYRRMLRPVGPVAVFGASNFPLAISVVGCDTICALGAGCPVVVKGHPGHPGTSELLAKAVGKAVSSCGMPPGIFSMIQGVGHEVGLAMVGHPLTRAVAFTGSLAGGRALFDAAGRRPNPIPVYAEMGSVNPVFILPGAIEKREAEIARGYIQSVTLSVGQFCTNPGLLVGLEGEPLAAFKNAVVESATAVVPATMVHGGIGSAFRSGIERLTNTDDVRPLAKAATPADPAKTEAGCNIFETDVPTFLANAGLREENFGPSSIVIHGRTPEDLERVAESLDGTLTATVHGTSDDLRTHRRLIEILERKAGRIVFNGFPTGIEIGDATHHGGPYPAATHSHFTSIGTASILRFVRPVCYHDCPDDVLQAELQNKNHRGIWRTIDGELSKEDILP